MASALRRARWSVLVLSGLVLHGASFAQSAARAGDTVSWTLSAPADNVRQGSRLQLALKGEVLDGWHVYSSEQLPTGPIPLLVKLDPGEVAASDGEMTATPPEKSNDTSFNLDTQYYSKSFTVTVPVRIGASAASGPQHIPVSVRFQTCNGRICKPPKTVRLTATVNVGAAG
jgi:hypothetical protein